MSPTSTGARTSTPDPPATSFLISLTRHQNGEGRPITELHTSLDHIGFNPASRGELEEWVRRFDAAGVSYAPVKDLRFGHHLNFRDRGNIPLEFYVPNAIVLQGYEELRTR